MVTMSAENRTARICARLTLTAAAFLALAFLVFSRPYAVPDGDEPRYVVLGANLYQHGVISNQAYDPAGTPAPGLPVGGPLTALELAAAMWIDSATRETFECVLSGSDCTVAYPGLRAFHVLEIALFLGALWCIALKLTGREVVAWASLGAALICKDLTYDARRVLTEPLFLATVGLFLVSWLAVWSRPQSRIWAAGLGLALAATILVKPAFQAIVPLVLLGYAISPLLPGTARTVREIMPSAAIFLITCIAALAPFLLYFQLCCGAFTLSNPSLLEAALSHRVAYNAMDMREWLAGWIYYLPDFGDNLAPTLFPDLAQIRLGWEQHSYYIHGRDVLHAEARAITAPEPATGYLIRTYVLGDWLWHAATSALLFWRGLFVGKLWGLIALPFFVAYPFITAAPNRLKYLILVIPVLAIAGLQSAISVSIPRYNLALIVPMSIAFAWCAITLGEWIVARTGHRARPGG